MQFTNNPGLLYPVHNQLQILLTHNHGIISVEQCLEISQTNFAKTCEKYGNQKYQHFEWVASNCWLKYTTKDRRKESKRERIEKKRKKERKKERERELSRELIA